MRTGAPIMRIFLVMVTATLMGCGGQVASTSDDASGEATSANGCVYGEIGRVSGIPYDVASTDDKVFVVATPDVASGTSNAQGNLYELSAGGPVRVADTTNTDIVSIGNGVAYFELDPSPDAGLRATKLQTADDNRAIRDLDVIGDAFVDMSSIAFDGKNKLEWYRWPTLPNSGQTRALPSIASTSAPGQPITTSSIDPDLLGVGAFVTDGVHHYAEFTTKEDGLVIGILPVNEDPKVVLVPAWAQPISVDAVDDTMLLYETGGDAQSDIEYWEVPKAGGSPLIAADVPLSSARPLLHDHTIYWVDETNAPSATIWKLSEIKNSIAEQVVTTSDILAMTADSCGIVYTTTDDAVQNGIVSRVRF